MKITTDTTTVIVKSEINLTNAVEQVYNAYKAWCENPSLHNRLMYEVIKETVKSIIGVNLFQIVLKTVHFRYETTQELLKKVDERYND